MTEATTGELIVRVWEALHELSEDVSHRALEADFEEWKARGEVPEDFDWVHINIDEINTDEARCIAVMWDAYNSLHALFSASNETTDGSSRLIPPNILDRVIRRVP